MDVLEKAHLVKELKQLIDAMNRPSLSLFETAKSKQRLKEIFSRCDTAIFKEPLQQFKQQLVTEDIPQECLEQSHYAMTYHGTFSFSDHIDKALYAAGEMGWAALKKNTKSLWQIWVIRPHLPFLRSPWFNTIQEAILWLQTHNESYLKTDQELRDIVPILGTEAKEPSNITSHSTQGGKTTVNLENPANSLHKAKSKENMGSSIQFEPIHSVTPTQQIKSNITPLSQPHFVKISKSLTSDTARGRSLVQRSIAITTTSPAPFYLDDFDCHLERVNPQISPALYRIESNALIDSDIRIDWLYLKSANEQQPAWESANVFISEQLYPQGQFSHYVVLIGTHHEEFASSIFVNYADVNRTIHRAFYRCRWQTFKASYMWHNTLFNKCIESNPAIWQDENTFAYLPASQISRSKFINFEESEADYFTPLLLLKERQKIRLIHGQKRLQRSQDDQAYPYLILDRADGYTWQLIRDVISALQQPISVSTLYSALINRLI